MGWNQIRGHAPARRFFQAAAERGRLGQAYLFVGPEGVGRRLFARELAKALLCERPLAALTACDKCPSCQQVAAETHPDVLTLSTPEGKHELPVEEMRDFCSQLSLKPVRGGRKIGIVLDADDFNLESANSFLKALEEPPPGVVLILIASSADQQLGTILSRCQVVRFFPLSPADLAAVLQEQGVTDAALRDRLVKLSHGSVARAIALNDDAVWKLREELIYGVTAERPDFVRLADLWWKFVEAGKNSAEQRDRASIVVGFLVDALQQALKIALGAATGVDAADDRRLTALAGRLGPDRLLDLIDRCVEAEFRIGRRVQLILVIEAILDHLTRQGRG
jgi:DNA polymerase-3 subunit delta'